MWAVISVNSFKGEKFYDHNLKMKCVVTSTFVMPCSIQAVFYKYVCFVNTCAFHKTTIHFFLLCIQYNAIGIVWLFSWLTASCYVALHILCISLTGPLNLTHTLHPHPLVETHLYQKMPHGNHRRRRRRHGTHNLYLQHHHRTTLKEGWEEPRPLLLHTRSLLVQWLAVSMFWHYVVAMWSARSFEWFQLLLMKVDPRTDFHYPLAFNG